MSKMYQIIEALCRAHHTNVTAMCRELEYWQKYADRTETGPYTNTVSRDNQ